MGDLLSDVRHDLRFATHVLRMSLKDARAWVSRGYSLDIDALIPPPPPRRKFEDGAPCPDCHRPTRNARHVEKHGLPFGWAWRGSYGFCRACWAKRWRRGERRR